MKTLEDFASDGPAQANEPYPYEGPESLRQPILDALTRVVDPEVAMSIVDVGLIYGVTVNHEKVHVLLTMTSAACPVTDVIKEEVESELDRLAPPELLVHVELVWDPPWDREMMSETAMLTLGMF